MSRLQEASLNELIDEVCKRNSFTALICCTPDGETLQICEGHNGLEILGAIAFLLANQQASLQRALRPSDE